MKRAFRENRARIADINTQIEDSLSGIRVVKSFANEKVEMKKFRQGNERFVNSKKLSYKYMGTYNSGMGAFTTLITISVLLTGAFYLTKGEMPVEDLVTVLLYINNFTDPVKKLITFTEPVSYTHLQQKKTPDGILEVEFIEMSIYILEDPLIFRRKV